MQCDLAVWHGFIFAAVIAYFAGVATGYGRAHRKATLDARARPE